jgi:hypothetical protein
LKSKWGLSIYKNQAGVDFRYFRKCRHFENILFELGAVDYIWLPTFILIRFWEIIKFLTNRARESPCIKIYTGHFTSDNKPDGIENATHNTLASLTRILFFLFKTFRKF